MRSSRNRLVPSQIDSYVGTRFVKTKQHEHHAHQQEIRLTRGTLEDPALV